MPAYEAMFIFRPDLKEEEQKALVTELESILKQNQAQIVSSQVFGRRRLAYDIGKCQEGLYYLINFSSQGDTVVASLKKVSRISEKILRVLVMKQKRKA